MARSGRAPVRVTGIAQLKQRLQDMPDQIKDSLVEAVKESAEAVRDDVKRNVPVDTRGSDSHHLKDAVDIRYREGGLVADVGWFGRENSYATYVEFGTRRRPAQPSLYPALERERGRFAARLTDEIRRALR
ncbi:HK97-gp10 family putative phage morphogenesis protein [Streptomyces sp. NPDC058470]|uniref:HK97-gp10 family putative phage morphogenesis protein n=1 Tax=Streptomyces sp. NPDC058470 TaxID=3346515 RepID=UPI0036606411